MDVAVHGEPRAQRAVDRAQLAVIRVGQDALPEVAGHGVDQRHVVLVSPLHRQRLQPGVPLGPDALGRPAHPRLPPVRLQRTVHVADHAGPAQLADAVHALRRTWPVERQVATVHDQVGTHPLQVREHGLEGHQVAMYVGDDRDLHRTRGY